MNLQDYIKYIQKTFNEIDSHEIDSLISLIIDSFINEQTIFIIGNGGSAANASHFAEDLVKGTLNSITQTKRIRALSLTDNIAFITALANDEGYERIFEQQLISFAKPGDVLIAISGSGNSPNIIKSIEWANANGLVTFGVTGFDGGKAKILCQKNIHINLNDMCTTETIHAFIFHFVVRQLKLELKVLS